MEASLSALNALKRGGKYEGKAVNSVITDGQKAVKSFKACARDKQHANSAKQILAAGTAGSRG